jgi:hypothetical protein
MEITTGLQLTEFFENNATSIDSQPFYYADGVINFGYGINLGMTGAVRIGVRVEFFSAGR